MDINVNIDPEQINREVSQAIINSAIGTHLKAAIEKEIAELGKRGAYGGENAMDRLVREEVTRIIRDVLTTPPYSERITEMVRAYVDESVVGDLVHASLEAMREKMRGY